jgi:hypothetical protein
LLRLAKKGKTMPQSIAMTWDPVKDVERLNELLNIALDYGFIHEDLYNEVYATMMRWAVKQDEFKKLYREEAEKEGYDVDNPDSFEEFLYDYYTGDTFWRDDLEEGKLDENFAKFVAVMFRFVIEESVFGCNDSYVSDFDSYSEKIEQYAKEFFEENCE